MHYQQSHLVLDHVINKLDMGQNMSNKMVQISAYADGIVIMSTNMTALEETLQNLQVAAQKVRLLTKKKK
jgi:hypothetical protein